MVYASGNSYEGQWQYDKKEGYGVMQWVSRREQYAGQWINDQQEGFGEHVWMDDKPAEASLGIMKQVTGSIMSSHTYYALSMSPHAQFIDSLYF